MGVRERRLSGLLAVRSMLSVGTLPISAGPSASVPVPTLVLARWPQQLPSEPISSSENWNQQSHPTPQAVGDRQ